MSEPNRRRGIDLDRRADSAAVGWLSRLRPFPAIYPQAYEAAHGHEGQHVAEVCFDCVEVESWFYRAPQIANHKAAQKAQQSPSQSEVHSRSPPVSSGKQPPRQRAIPLTRPGLRAGLVT